MGGGVSLKEVEENGEGGGRREGNPKMDTKRVLMYVSITHCSPVHFHYRRSCGRWTQQSINQAMWSTQLDGQWYERNSTCM